MARYVQDIEGLRAVLRITRSVLSGSTVLHILDIQGSDAWAPQDLDVYSPIDTVRRMVHYLITAEGYRLHQIHDSTYQADGAGLRQVYSLVKGSCKIDVIQSTTLSALHPIPFFWGSHLMSYIGADTFCMPYPTLTLQGRGLMNPVALIDHRYAHKRTLDVMAKYRTRGYDFPEMYDITLFVYLC
ncbi:hypothetical protein OH77DRAFT_1499553 [Trametes cingulata]|nr:hypothetical protein OH77DRAFT_1499553 [Trametes cingulata]